MRQVKCARCGVLFDASNKYVRLCPDCAASGKSAPTICTHICKSCGLEFEGGPRAQYCPDCRRERDLIRDREYHRKPAARPIGSIDICVKCGKSYIVSSGMQKYCPDCAKSAVAGVDRSQGMEYYTRNRDSINASRMGQRRLKYKVCVVCGTEFDPEGKARTVCSDACRAALKSYRQAQSDYKRGHRKTPPVLIPLQQKKSPDQ